MTFYIPAGTQVVGVEYVREDPAQPGAYIPYPLPGPAVMPIGSGPIGQTCPAAPPNLQGTTLGPNVLGVASAPVAAGTGCHRGTLAGVYGDIGIYYSTDPRTAYGTWTGGPLTNNRGVTSVPTTKWDAFQLLAYGVKSPSLPIVDKADGRGNAPWGLAGVVAGPQSGYAWQFDKDVYDANPARPASEYLTVGPGSGSSIRAARSPRTSRGWSRRRWATPASTPTRSAAPPPASSSTARTRCRPAPRPSGSPTVVSSSGVPRWSG